MYIMNYLDRNNIAAVRLAGLQTDLDLSSVQYQVCPLHLFQRWKLCNMLTVHQTTVSILFVGYILMQIPSNLFLNKTGKPAIYLPSCMIIWGIISGATAACQNFAGLVVCRWYDHIPSNTA
jgi:MFS family permease